MHARLSDVGIKLAEFLRFHGYFDGTEELERAVREFQRYHGAPVTGRLNYQTCRLLNAARCAHSERARSPDVERSLFFANASAAPRLATIGVATTEIHVETSVPQGHEYELIHARWTRTNLGYALVGSVPQPLRNGAWNAIRRAFETWSSQTCIDCVEREDPSGAEIRVLWTPGRVSDPTSPDPFYGPGGKIAVGYYPYPFSGELGGDLHLDTSEHWMMSGDGDGFDVETVALHEIGHCLGIGHSRNPASAMFPIYKEWQRELSPLDAQEVARHYRGVV